MTPEGGTRIHIAQEFTPKEAWNSPFFGEVTPPEQLPSSEIARRLQESVFGQDAACQRIADIVFQAEHGIRDPKKPKASFLLAGPTGVGKTETAKIIAQYLYPDASDNNLVIVNCAELQDKAAVNRLKGSDPKYVGFGSPVLIMPDMIKNGAVVVFDEFEKAHPEVWKWVMSVLDEGKATLFQPTGEKDPAGSDGQKIAPTVLSFKDSYLVFTTNAGAAQLQEKTFQNRKRPLGFQTQSAKMPPIDTEKTVLDAIHNKVFKDHPEVIGRIGHTIVFEPLKSEHYKRIIDKFVEKRIFNTIGISVALTEELKEWIIKQSKTALFGARDLESTLDRYLINQFVNYKASGKFHNGGPVVAHIIEGEIKFKQYRALESTDTITRKLLPNSAAQG